MLKWNKREKIFDPKMISSTTTHGQVPFGLVVDNKLRVFFTSRPPKDISNNHKSYIHYIEYSLEYFPQILYIHKRPLLELGNPGTFDETGTMPCSVLRIENKLFMYYVGWSRAANVPYHCENGLAISTDNGNTFSKYSEGPIMGRSFENPYIIGCPRVYQFNGELHMWYLGGTGWIFDNNKYESVYNLKHAVSRDGLVWETQNHDVIEKKYEQECQTSVSVFEYNGLYHMYFTFRYAIDFRNPERGYRIGYAYSKDLKEWTRSDDMGGIAPSPEGWDSEMICYPHVLKIDERLIMLYCGNQFGVNGFGYAELDPSSV
jgi:predicted GH43/DUF377 family glycosyl hydrolase